MAEFKKMIKEDYGIVQKLITTRNPQANAILERVHQTIGNMFRTQQINKIDLDEEEPWSGILAAIAFSVRATVHTTLQHSPMQLVFGRDPFINISHEVNWRLVNKRRQDRIIKNNIKENKKRKKHEYCIGDKVLIKNSWDTKYRDEPYSGPFKVDEVYNNGTVLVDTGLIKDKYNIRNIHPYKD